jgi:hypothetical protein
VKGEQKRGYAGEVEALMRLRESGELQLAGSRCVTDGAGSGWRWRSAAEDGSDGRLVALDVDECVEVVDAEDAGCEAEDDLWVPVECRV